MSEPEDRPVPNPPATPRIVNGRATLDLDTHVPSLLNWIANKLGRGASAEFRDHFDIGITEWRIIALLAIEPGIKANRIVEVIGLDKGPVSRCVKNMHAKGLVTLAPDKTDGRSQILSLSPSGEALHDAILPAALERERRLLSALSEDEVHQLIDMLNRLHAALPQVNRRGEAES
ncbi:MAG: MarR family winged helix-turn-helix transcriptional regulator [Marinibacterium sp.]|nr:MarR family winged helix-turn-helix transcriptional regulator [Marinibacterium sp.]